MNKWNINYSVCKMRAHELTFPQLTFPQVQVENKILCSGEIKSKQIGVH